MMMFRTVCGCYLSLHLQLMALTNLCEGVFKNMHSLPVFGGEGLGDYCESTLHNLNCSVGPKKGIEGDTALDCKMKRQKDPGGISLTFSSNNQSMAGDYEFDTQYRLLDFSKYTYSSSDSDKNYQRTLSLQELTAFSELTYKVTVYNMQGLFYYEDLWQSTIAVAFFPGEKDVSFVFDPVPDNVTFQMYNVSLIDALNNTLYRNQRIFKEQPTQNVFLDVEDGIYYILIEVNTTDYNCPESCRYKRSHSFIVGNFHPLQVRVRGASKDPTELMKMAAILIGSGIVLLLLLLGILCYLRRKKDFDVPVFLNNDKIESDDEDDIIFNDRYHILWKSKSFWRENQPLMGSNASMTSFSDSPHVKKKATFIENPSLQGKCKSQMSTGIIKRIPAMVHVRPSDSVPTLKLFGSDTNSEHSYSSTSPRSSIYSISRLQLKTIPSTLEDSDLPSQSSGYEDCEPIKTPHSSYESLNSSCTSSPHLYQELLPNCETGQINVQDLDSKEAYTSASVRNSKTIHDIDVLPSCLKCLKVISKKDKTSEGFRDNNDNYSNRSESITSLDIDTCEFT